LVNKYLLVEEKMKSRFWFTALSMVVVFAFALTACTPAATAQPTATSVAATSLPTGTTAPTMAASPVVAGTTAATATAEATSAATSAVATLTPPTCYLQPEAGATITFSGWGDQSEQKVYTDSITRFNSVCPDIKVIYNPIPTNFQTKIEAEMAGGTAPDVFYVDDTLMNALGRTGQLLALDDLMSKAYITRDQFIPQLLSLFTYNGKTYGLPKDWGTLGLIYLPEAFTAANLPMPTDSWTFTDLMNAAKTIATTTKYKGFCQAPDYARLAPWVFGNGGSFTSSDYATATFNSQPVTDAVNNIATMLQDKSLVQPSDVGASWCGEALGKELVAMTLEGGWMVQFMNTTYPNVKWAAAEIPQGSKTHADIIFTNAIGINANTKSPNAAADFLFFLTSEYNQGLIQATGFAYSTHPDQLSQLNNPYDLEISKGGLLPDTMVDYWGPYSGNARTAMSNALTRIYTGTQSVTDALTQGQTDVQNALNGK
jgi:multiple sugar transport system substrate-binding protein